MSLFTSIWGRRRARVGARARLDGTLRLLGSGSIELGDDVRIVSSPAVSHLLAEAGARLQIGDGVRIGHGAAISATGHISIGAGALIGPFAVISDSDFHEVGDRNSRPPPRPVRIGRGVRLGARVTVLPGSTIGDGAIIEAGSVVGGEIPAGSRAGGVPARPLDQRAHPAEALDLETAVPLAVMRVLGLREPPDARTGPGQLEQWDSLGALKLLVSLEEEFRVSLPESAVVQARSVAELVAAIDAARRNASAPRT